MFYFDRRVFLHRIRSMTPLLVSLLSRLPVPIRPLLSFPEMFDNLTSFIYSGAQRRSCRCPWCKRGWKMGGRLASCKQCKRGTATVYICK